MTDHTETKKHLMHIVESTITAVAPDPAMRAALSLDGDVLTVDGRSYDLAQYERILVIGAGKASAAMARTLEDILGERVHDGIIATKYEHALPLKKIQVLESGHPVPDAAGEAASRALLGLARDTTDKDLVFCLLSGGASAIVPAPCAPVTLEHKQAATRKLLECGATINEINAIRKHLSLFKGGHLARALAPATVVTLIISDVVGDYLDVIGSGPTAPDESTFLDCQAILDKYRLCSEIPDEVTRLIADGCGGGAPETCKEGDACFEKVHNVIIAGNAMAVSGAANAARSLGYEPVLVDSAMEGEAKDVAARFVRLAREYYDGVQKANSPVCLLAGGETTVIVKGKGKGGRNQEFALAAAIEMTEFETGPTGISIMSLGTDGSDGPTDAAGALVFPDTVARSGHEPHSVRQFLTDNNSYEFFDQAGTLLRTGPTLTNVMDVVAILVSPE